MSPTWNPDQKGVKVQIIDVFALELATGYDKDPEGRLLLSSEPSVSAGRTWSLAKACQLVRNDKRPHSWVVLHRHKKAWGLFWAGGGLQHCRELLSQQVPASDISSALVAATPEALLRLVLDLGIDLPSPTHSPAAKPANDQHKGLWRIIAWTSLAWLTVLGVTVAGFLTALERQDRKLELLLERTAPSSGMR